MGGLGLNKIKFYNKRGSVFAMQLNMKNFISEDEMEYGKDMLCLVSFWDELPMFVILQKKQSGIRLSFDGSNLENMKILKWSYLPDTWHYKNKEVVIDEIF